MQKWEYLVIEQKVETGFLRVKDFPTLAPLEQTGNEGWELVSVVPVDGKGGSFPGVTTELKWIFKRPKE